MSLFNGFARHFGSDVLSSKVDVYLEYLPEVWETSVSLGLADPRFRTKIITRP